MLIELVVVLLLISIVASAAILSLRVPLRTARIHRALTSIEDADRRARREAQRSGQAVELTFDVSNGKVTQAFGGVDGPGGVGRRRTTSNRSLELGGVKLEGFIDGESSITDNFTIRYSPNGRSPTYAINVKTQSQSSSVTGRDPNERFSSVPTWLVVVGATGQCIKTHKDSEVEAILRR